SSAGVQFPRRWPARRDRPVLDGVAMTMTFSVDAAARPTTDSLLEIDDLKTHFFTRDGVVRAVDGVTVDIKPGETVGVVGESGCGKRVTAHTVLRLLPPKVSRIVGGQIRFTRRNGDTVDLTKVDPRGGLIRSIRGNEIAMIFQEPMTSLSPVHTI